MCPLGQRPGGIFGRVRSGENQVYVFFPSGVAWGMIFRSFKGEFSPGLRSCMFLCGYKQGAFSSSIRRRKKKKEHNMVLFTIHSYTYKRYLTPTCEVFAAAERSFSSCREGGGGGKKRFFPRPGGGRKQFLGRKKQRKPNVSDKREKMLHMLTKLTRI